jgi:dihydropteroate synthase
MRLHWRKQRENTPRLPYRVRQNRINELNQQKQSLIRAGAPYWKIQQIDNQLSKL